MKQPTVAPTKEANIHWLVFAVSNMVILVCNTLKKGFTEITTRDMTFLAADGVNSVEKNLKLF